MDTPHCCEHDCSKEADFTLYGSNGYPDNVTHTCTEHIGHLLGTPVGQPPDSYWTIIPLREVKVEEYYA